MPTPGQEKTLRRYLHWLGRHELSVLVLVVLIAAGVWAFAELADEVLEGETRAVDRAVLLALRTPTDLNDPIGPLWVEETVRDFTALGGLGLISFISLAALGFLLLQRKFRAGLLLVTAIAGAGILSTLLKLGFDRPRPDLVAHHTQVMTASFPSGHAFISAATYLTLGALLARVQPNRALKAYLLLLSVVLTLLVGFSRIYLGVHWPTDVLAGWAGGGAWALFCWLVARWLQRRGQLEEDLPENGHSPTRKENP